MCFVEISHVGREREKKKSINIITLLQLLSESFMIKLSNYVGDS